jgi:hypothetical protein
VRHTRTIGNSRPSSEGLSSGPTAEQLAVIPSVELANTRSIGALPGVAALAAGLTSSCGGEHGPAIAEQPGEGSLPGGPGSPPIAFDVAAVIRGHDISTVDGQANARHDFRVWDLVERMRP